MRAKLIYEYVHDRALTLQIGLLSKDQVIEQVYKPNLTYDDKDIDRLYENLKFKIE